MEPKRKIKTRVLVKEAYDLIEQWTREELPSEKRDGKLAGLEELLEELNLPTDASGLDRLYWNLMRDD